MVAPGPSDDDLLAAAVQNSRYSSSPGLTLSRLHGDVCANEIGGQGEGVAEVDGSPFTGFQAVRTPTGGADRRGARRFGRRDVSGVRGRSNSSRSWGRSRASSRAWSSQSRVRESWSAFFLTTEPMSWRWLGLAGAVSPFPVALRVMGL